MKRKWDESGSKLDEIPDDPKRQSLGDGNKGKEIIDRSKIELDSLPLDLKLAILTRLSAKSLSKFRCVSKTWSSIIRTPEFVRSFFSVSSKRPRFILALSNGICNSREESLIFLFSFSADSSSPVLEPNFEMAIPFVTFGDLEASCTSLHGLLAVKADGRLVICNPSTEEPVLFSMFTNDVGYDPIDDQYKAFSVSTAFSVSSALLHRVLTLGQDRDWRYLEPPSTMPLYSLTGKGLSINGFIYYRSYSQSRPTKQSIVCFNVRSEKLTYIKPPDDDAPFDHPLATFIDYKGKFACIVQVPYNCRFSYFKLWVLEDVEKHDWSVKTCPFPLPLWDFFEGYRICFSGTNEAGEIIMSPTLLPNLGRPFYIFYYNVEAKKIKRVRLRGIGDNQEFRNSYGFVDKGDCHVRIAPQHVESIRFFKKRA